MRGRKAIFLDKDGTLIVDVPFNVDPDLIRLTQGAGEGVRALAEEGYELIVVSNQSGVARGYFSEDDLVPVEARVRELLAGEGVSLAGFYHCPHHPDAVLPEFRMRCDCRKPAPGLVRRAATAHGIDLKSSWLIGDILDDVEAGRRAGCRTLLLANGNETEWKPGRLRVPHAVALDLSGAARIIVEAERRAARSGAPGRAWEYAS